MFRKYNVETLYKIFNGLFKCEYFGRWRCHPLKLTTTTKTTTTTKQRTTKKKKRRGKYYKCKRNIKIQNSSKIK